MFHVTNIRVALDVSGPARPNQWIEILDYKDKLRTVLRHLGRTASLVLCQ